jgi:hypothetical protein
MTVESSDEEDSEVQLPQKDGSEDADESEKSSSDGSSSDFGKMMSVRTPVGRKKRSPCQPVSKCGCAMRIANLLWGRKTYVTPFW